MQKQFLITNAEMDEPLNWFNDIVSVFETAFKNIRIQDLSLSGDWSGSKFDNVRALAPQELYVDCLSYLQGFNGYDDLEPTGPISISFTLNYTD